MLLVLESIPELEGKLLKPNATKPASPDEIIKQTEAATCLILVY